MADPVFRLRSNERAVYIEVGDLLRDSDGAFREVVSVSPSKVPGAVLVDVARSTCPFSIPETERRTWLRPDVPPTPEPKEAT